jgi:hypothetical protein
VIYGMSKPHLDFLGGYWWAQYRGWNAVQRTPMGAYAEIIQLYCLHGDFRQ